VKKVKNIFERFWGDEDAIFEIRSVNSSFFKSSSWVNSSFFVLFRSSWALIETKTSKRNQKETIEAKISVREGGNTHVNRD
jgi:hypothetical protein